MLSLMTLSVNNTQNTSLRVFIFKDSPPPSRGIKGFSFTENKFQKEQLFEEVIT